MREENDKLLEDFSKLQVLKSAEKNRRENEKARKRELPGYRGKTFTTLSIALKYVFARFGDEWAFLALLGVIMAIISFLMDLAVGLCISARAWLYIEIMDDPVDQYFAWISLPICLILFSVGFSRLVSPQAIGSGIPEMKIILSGVHLKEYLTFRTLVAKVVGLTTALGTGLPLGREGPFVHIASITAAVLSKFVVGFRGIFENESRTNEMLAAACALGVGSCFASPVGGVLFSIEVTAVYFAVRNYWRGFFASVCGAVGFRLLTMWFHNSVTVTPVFKTSFNLDFPYDPEELVAFAILGTLCGIGGALYVWLQREYVLFMKKRKSISSFLQNNYFVYPGVVTFMVFSLMYPPWLGKYMAGGLNTNEQVGGLFGNFTWSKENLTFEEMIVVQDWQTEYTGIFVSLASFILFTFFASIACLSIPAPCGVFVPALKIGAGLGRVLGELMHIWFPYGIISAGCVSKIVPGAYATVGAAAFTGAVTQTISTSVIICEMTGQLTYIVPVMIAVLLANAVASFMGPSIFDSAIIIRKLPYLPDLLPNNNAIYKVFVEDFMVSDVKYIFHNITYQKLKDILIQNKKIKSFPLVDNDESMILLGSVKRAQLIELIDRNVGKERRLQASTQTEIRQSTKNQIAPNDIKQWFNKQHRFLVTPVVNGFKVRSENQLNREVGKFTPNVGSEPKKSILKSSSSFSNIKRSSPTLERTRSYTPYSTVTAGDSRIRQAFESIFKKSQQLRDVETGAANSDGSNKLADGKNGNKKVHMPSPRVVDMSPEEQKKWEQQQMELPVDFSLCQIDPAPLQLVEMTSLLQVHTLFSMLGVKIGYVTSIGKLVGVVGLKELRHAVEEVNNGNLPAIWDINSTERPDENCDTSNEVTNLISEPNKN